MSKTFTVTSPTDPRVRSGMYVGGIGSGGFEPRADGRFHRNQIYNEWRRENQLDLMFFHRAPGKEIRSLRFGGYNSAWGVFPGVDGITYSERFPDVSLSYPDQNVSITFSSFFIPGDVKNSSLPCVRMQVKGSGKLLLYLPVPGKCTYVHGKGSLVVTGKDREMGFSSKTGTFLVTNTLAWKTKVLYWDKWEPGIKPSGDLGTDFVWYAGIFWEGDIDDEAILAWYCPESRDLEGNFIGHRYANDFDSCADVLRYVRRNARTLQRKTEAFADSVHSARDVPRYVTDAYTAQLSTFVKASWLTKDGRFGVWEGGCGCCGLQTTDVSYYGSWLYAKLFPELEKSGMRLTAQFQRKKDGWIPHFFPGTFEHIDEYRRKDMNMQYVLMAYRDVTLWRDRAFLREVYPSVKRAMKGAEAWDTNGDMIPEVEARAQTFDTWDFTGSSIYLATLWLASLHAAAQMAPRFGDTASGKHWSSMAEIVETNIERIFWNGEYFILAQDVNGTRDECCLLDALSGDWYSRLLGLGGILDDAKVSSHLKACIKYNRTRIDHSYMNGYLLTDEDGHCMINGGYPDKRRTGHQQYEPWTGLEYTFGLHCLLMGMKTEGLRAIRDVEERHDTCGMHWNHIECGGEYFRPMVIGAAWDLLRSVK